MALSLFTRFSPGCSSGFRGAEGVTLPPANSFCSTTSLELDFGTLPISIGEVWLSSAHLKMKVLWIFLFAGADEFAFAGIL